MLENLRFNAGETSKDDAERADFARSLAALGDVYVNDAFGALHRKHASVYELAQLLPHYAGWLVQREVEVLGRLTENPDRPYVVVLGGAKVSDKLAVIESLLPKVDRLLIGGGMCFTFLTALGYETGRSLLESDMVETCRELLARSGDRILLPVDIVAATKFAADARHDTVPDDSIPPDRLGLDIGPVDGGGVRRRASRCPYRVLEWTDGCLRARPVRGRNAGGRRGDHEGGRIHRRRRGRLRGGGASIGDRRGRVRAHLDRRGRVAGVPRGQDPSRPGGTGFLTES